MTPTERTNVTGRDCQPAFSASAFKSLAVKALRIGWLAGLERAERELGKGPMRGLLTCGAFEDSFPAESELSAVMDEIRRLDYSALCRRETHHGRGHTAEFCRLQSEAVAAAQNQRGELWTQARALGLWLPQRALNCFWTWLAIKPQDAGKVRAVDATPWRGMPLAVLDAHTLEGKRAGRIVTILGGQYHNHAKIALRVAAEGWQGIRREAHAGTIPEAKEIRQADFGF